jgi:modification methylase
LILTSPPTGATMRIGTPGKGRLGLVRGMTAVLAGCVPLLGAGGVIVVVARPSRRVDRLVDVSGLVATAASNADLTLIDRRVAIGDVARDERFVARHGCCGRAASLSTSGTRPPVGVRRHDDVTVFAATRCGLAP